MRGGKPSGGNVVSTSTQITAPKFFVSFFSLEVRAIHMATDTITLAMVLYGIVIH